MPEREESNCVIKLWNFHIRFLHNHVFLNFSKSIHHRKLQEGSICSFWDHQFKWSDSCFFFILCISYGGHSLCNISVWTHHINVTERAESNGVVKTMKFYTSFLHSDAFLNFSTSSQKGARGLNKLVLRWLIQLKWHLVFAFFMGKFSI